MDEANPARSPTTPPPSATTTSVRDSPLPLKASSAFDTFSNDLCCSPSGISQTDAAKPAALSDSISAAPYIWNMVGFDTTKARSALFLTHVRTHLPGLTLPPCVIV